MTRTPEVRVTNSPASAKRKRVGYLVLVALAWFQVAIAGHQFEHVLGDLADACTVCKHLERHDAAVPQETAEPVCAAVPPVPAVHPNSLFSAKVLRNYESRAPPSA